MTDALLEWGPWGLALSAFLAGGVLAAPSEAVLVALVAGGLPAPRLVLIATIANTLGAVTLILLGRGGRLVAARRIDVLRLQKVESWYARHGPPLLLLSWLPVVGDVLVLGAGVLRIRWALALPLMVVGKAARYAVVAGLTREILG